MERKFGDVGNRVETPPESGLLSGVTHAATGDTEAGTTFGAELAKGSEAFQAAVKKAAAAMSNGIQEGREEVITYARREPLAALAAAAGLGFVIGLALAIGSRGSSGGEKAWLPQTNLSLGKRTRTGWGGFLRRQ